MSESTNPDIYVFSLRVQRLGGGTTVSVALSEDDILNAAAESSRFRGKLKGAIRHLRSSNPQVFWLATHLTRMDNKEAFANEADAEPTKPVGIEELIEMLKLQQQVNESYAKLAILLGEAYVGKAKR